VEIHRILVIGAGTMGHGIAQVAAQSGYSVDLYDVDPKVAAAGLAKLKANLEKGVEKGKVTAADRDAALSRIATTTDLAGAAAKADLAVEAIPERMDLKRKVFGALSAAAPAHAVLASNTSSLSIAEIAAATTRPTRVVGMHFFNPVHLKPLLEIVRTADTDPAALEAAVAVGKRMGKSVVVVKDSPGFATSRLGIALGLEAMRMVEEGVASPADIDTAMEKGYGHAMGPLRTTDLVGLDVRLGIAEYLDQRFPGGRFTPPAILRKLVAEGKLGQKSGKGFYDWTAPA
jgi:3-hydroxybutyryl-CoA dehydrogenase